MYEGPARRALLLLFSPRERELLARRTGTKIQLELYSPSRGMSCAAPSRNNGMEVPVAMVHERLRCRRHRRRRAAERGAAQAAAERGVGIRGRKEQYVEGWAKMGGSVKT